MSRLSEKKPILYAVAWIALYVVAVNLGDLLSEQLGVASAATSVLLLVFSVILFFQVKRHIGLDSIGLQPLRKEDISRSLYYLPLAALVVIQFASGIDPERSSAEIATVCLLMIGVGFIEETMFRGLLFKGIREKSGVNRAIIISGVTFGLGHIVNLLRGYSSAEQIGQIVVAVAIGIALALLVAVTGNIVPGIVFHVLFNIGGTVANQMDGQLAYLAILITVISMGYSLYLSRKLPHSRRDLEKSAA